MQQGHIIQQISTATTMDTERRRQLIYNTQLLKVTTAPSRNSLSTTKVSKPSYSHVAIYENASIATKGSVQAPVKHGTTGHSKMKTGSQATQK